MRREPLCASQPQGFFMWIFQDLPLAFTEGMLRLIRGGGGGSEHLSDAATIQWWNMPWRKWNQIFKSHFWILLWSVFTSKRWLEEGWSSGIQLHLLLLSIYKQHQFSWGGPSAWWQQIKWGFIGRECMIMWRLTRRSVLKYIFSQLESCGLLIPLAKMATAATAFQDNSHLTGPALTVRTSQFGSSRSRRRGTVRLSIHLPVSF